MKLFRFMSKEENEKLMSGETLTNKIAHKGKTASVGFCFMEYEEDNDIEYSHKFLNGIVTDDIVVVFETDKKNVNKSWGIYAAPYGNLFDEIGRIEYCTTQYNKATFKILKYGANKINFGYDIEWCDSKKQAMDIINKKIEEEDNFVKNFKELSKALNIILIRKGRL